MQLKHCFSKLQKSLFSKAARELQVRLNSLTLTYLGSLFVVSLFSFQGFPKRRHGCEYLKTNPTTIDLGRKKPRQEFVRTLHNLACMVLNSRGYDGAQ